VYSFSLNDDSLLVTKRGNSFNQPVEFLAGSVEYESIRYLLTINRRLAKQKKYEPETSGPLIDNQHKTAKLEN
jgi:hypothetical protein